MNGQEGLESFQIVAFSYVENFRNARWEGFAVRHCLNDCVASQKPERCHCWNAR